MTHWSDDAACSGMDTELFYAIPTDRTAIRQAKRICATCAVREECAEAGKTEHFGVWGGMTPRERNKKFRHCGDWVDAIGSARRLQALAHLGYGTGHIERELLELGVTSMTHHGIGWIRDSALQTQREKADAIVRVYDRLVARGLNTARRSVISRKQALLESWAPPEAWVGLDIDNPSVHPRPLKAAA